MMEEKYKKKYPEFRKRKKRQRKIKCLLRLLTVAVSVFIIIAVWKDRSREKNVLKSIRDKFETTVIKQAEETDISRPVEREDSEVKECLAEMAEEDERFDEINKNQESYPEIMLASLVNNPEMIDFVKNYNNDRKQTSAKLTGKEKKEAFPLFIQWDQRWGYIAYGGSDIGMSGCGPTCLSMVIFALTRDSNMTPDAVAAFSEEEGYYVDGIGTSWSLMTDGAAKYGLIARQISLDKRIMEQQLDSGHPIICALRAGDFTTLGHFIMIYDYDENGFMINDPNCKARSRKKWKYEELSSQIKNLWAYDN